MDIYRWAMLFVLILNLVYYAFHLRTNGRVNRVVDLLGCVCVFMIICTITRLQ